MRKKPQTRKNRKLVHLDSDGDFFGCEIRVFLLALGGQGMHGRTLFVDGSRL